MHLNIYGRLSFITGFLPTSETLFTGFLATSGPLSFYDHTLDCNCSQIAGALDQCTVHKYSKIVTFLAANTTAVIGCMHAS